MEKIKGEEEEEEEEDPWKMLYDEMKK